MIGLRHAVLGVLIAIVLAAGSFAAGTRAGDPRAGSFDEVERTARELQAHSSEPISDRELIRAAIDGMLRALPDPYAARLSPDERRQVEALVEGSIVGIGVWLRASEAGLRITGVVEGAPAAEAGLRRGDVIVEMDGRSMRGASVARAGRMLDGVPGDPVTLVVERRDERRTVELERARIEVPSVEARMEDGDVGYARLSQFGRGAADQLRTEVRRLLRGGAEAIVLDLRGNAGGLADEAIDVAGLFLDGGVVTRLRERGKPEEEIAAERGSLGSFPIAVLVDEASASASEMVAGALQDRDRATLVGQPTFGKGSVLTVSRLSGGGRFQYTTAFFFTPDGHHIEGRGIHPDVRVRQGEEGDRQLGRALRILTG